MKKTVGVILGITVMVIGLFMCRAVTMAKSNHDIIHSGIYIGDIDVAGMTEQEAKEAVESYVDTLKDISLTLHAVDDNPVEVTTGELGITWKNPEIVEEAFSLGKEGNIVKRYKELADLEHQNLIYDIELAFDDKAIRSVLEEKCSPFDKEAKDASLRRENGAFVVEGGQTGEKVDVDASAAELNQFLQNGWNHQSAELDLVVTIDEPKGKTEDLERVKDVLGTFTTSYKTSGADRSANVANGCSLINGVTLLPGEEFSAYETVSPFSKENGY
ncbi:MAG: peptidoglycan binding domain-containing protein, partial [Lachnospiraceae bacterium]